MILLKKWKRVSNIYYVASNPAQSSVWCFSLCIYTEKSIKYIFHPLDYIFFKHFEWCQCQTGKKMKMHKTPDLLMLRTNEYVQIQGMILKYIGIDSLAAVCQLCCLTACMHIWNVPQLCGQTIPISWRNYTQGKLLKLICSSGQ